MSLTPQQEAFAQLVASGKSQSDAYRGSYKCEKSKNETIWRKASELMENGKVSARVSELKEQLSEKALWTREDSVRILANIANDEEASRKDKTGAIKVLNEMHGFNAPTKIEHSGGVTVTASLLDEDI